MDRGVWVHVEAAAIKEDRGAESVAIGKRGFQKLWPVGDDGEKSDVVKRMCRVRQLGPSVASTRPLSTASCAR